MVQNLYGCKQKIATVFCSPHGTTWLTYLQCTSVQAILLPDSRWRGEAAARRGPAAARDPRRRPRGRPRRRRRQGGPLLRLEVLRAILNCNPTCLPSFTTVHTTTRPRNHRTILGDDIIERCSICDRPLDDSRTQPEFRYVLNDN